MTARKITFKNNEPTGMYRSFFDTYCDIKLRGSVIGLISVCVTDDGDKYRVRFMIKDGAQKCGWRWVTLKAKFDRTRDGLKQAKEWTRDNFEIISKSIDIREENDR